MDIREMIEKCKPFAPVVSAAVVAACVAGSLYGYEAPVYEMKAVCGGYTGAGGRSTGGKDQHGRRNKRG